MNAVQRPSSPLKASERMLIEHECTRLCNQFHVLIDAYRYAEVTELFTPDAKWHHRTGPLEGIAAIREYLLSKATTPVTRHVLTNVLIDVDDDDHSRGIAYVTMYYGVPPPDGVPVLRDPMVLVTYHDEFRRTDDGWKFASRRPVPTFKHPAFGEMMLTKVDEERGSPRG